MNKTPIKTVKRTSGYYNLLVKKEDKVIISKSKLSKKDFCKLYFQKLEDNLTKYDTPEELLEAYKTLWSKYDIKCNYIDSWGHLWEDQFPSDKTFIQYLCSQ